MGWMSHENQLLTQHQQRLYNRGARRNNSHWGKRYLYCSSVRGQRVGDVSYEVVRSERGGATQIHHLNLLKAWREAESFSLLSLVSEREELGPEVPKATNRALLLCEVDLSCPKWRPGTAEWRKSASSFNGRLTLCVTTSWDAHPPSVWTMRRFRGSTAYSLRVISLSCHLTSHRNHRGPCALGRDDNRFLPQILSWWRPFQFVSVEH